MRSMRYAAAVLAFGTCLSGCAATTTTNKVAVDYNRYFANSRDEVLVDNILRASMREPMEFSTMGTVTGGVRNSGSITLPFANLIGGKFSISPSATVNDGINPNVTIVPLADKEFTAAMLTPISTDVLKYFLDQGWDSQMLLMLTVGGIICDDGSGNDKNQTVVLNRGQVFELGPNGEPTKKRTAYQEFKTMFSTAKIEIEKPKQYVVVMPAKEALSFAKDGLGKDQKIESLEPGPPAKDGSSTIKMTISKAARAKLTGTDANSLCQNFGIANHVPVRDFSGSLPVDRSSTPPDQVNIPRPQRVPKRGARRARRATPHRNETQPKPAAYAVLRSVESIIYYLGETERDWLRRHDCGRIAPNETWPDYDRNRPEEGERALTLLRIYKTCTLVPPPFPTFVQTKFHDNYYFVRRKGDYLWDTDDTDRTLTTLTFLDELISLETSQSVITSSTPAVTVPAQ